MKSSTCRESDRVGGQSAILKAGVRCTQKFGERTAKSPPANPEGSLPRLDSSSPGRSALYHSRKTSQVAAVRMAPVQACLKKVCGFVQVTSDGAAQIIEYNCECIRRFVEKR